VNNVVLTGRVASDVELKFLPAGTAMAKFRIAVRDPFKKKEEGKPDADFFDVVAWRGSAEFAGKYLEKGAPVGVKGRLQQQTWKLDDGSARSRVVINADDVEGLGPAKAGDQSPAAEKPASKPAPQAAEEPDYDPFADVD
jgi:single-strand DNA-binding protein